MKHLPNFEKFAEGVDGAAGGRHGTGIDPLAMGCADEVSESDHRWGQMPTMFGASMPGVRCNLRIDGLRPFDRPGRAGTNADNPGCCIHYRKRRRRELKRGRPFSCGSIETH